MVDTRSANIDTIKRCAVCKIDLKGKFVYVDCEIERLIGHSKEKLFGKSFLDYLDEPSQIVLNHLIQQRNHYETYYDSVSIVLISAGKRPIKATAIFSLNFIAGNPANFMVIITPTELPSTPATAKDSESFQLFLESIVETGGVGDWRTFLDRIRYFASARDAALYVLSNENLEPLCAVTRESGSEFAFALIPELVDQHREVLSSGNNFDFTDHDQYGAAVEKNGSAPSEYIARIAFDQNHVYLLRLIFDEEIDLDTARRNIKRNNVALRLVNTFSPEASPTEASEINVQFTIGLLDCLGCGGILIDNTGEIVGYNPTTRNLLQRDEITGKYDTLAEIISVSSEARCKNLLMEYFNNEDAITQPLRFAVTTPAGISVTMIVVRLANDVSDRTSCVALIPHQTPETGSNGQSSSFRKSATI